MKINKTKANLYKIHVSEFTLSDYTHLNVYVYAKSKEDARIVVESQYDPHYNVEILSVRRLYKFLEDITLFEEDSIEKM